MGRHRVVGRDSVHAEDMLHETEIGAGVMNVAERDQSGEDREAGAHEDLDYPLHHHFLPQS